MDQEQEDQDQKQIDVRQLKLERDLHIQYLLKNLNKVYYKFVDQIMMYVFFSLQSLDLLDAIHLLTAEQVKYLINWIYSTQIFFQEESSEDSSAKNDNLINDQSMFSNSNNNRYDFQHIVFTYSAICSLKILKDDQSRLRKMNILKSLKNNQLEDGNVKSQKSGYEADIRFIYTALAIQKLIGEEDSPHGINKEKALQYILKCRNYNDGGFGLNPNLESHNGATYCALASLYLMKKLDTIDYKTKLIHWLMSHQIEQHQLLGGFRGRTNKIPDSCYSFWVGASLSLLGFSPLINTEKLENFIYICQNEKGGIQKYPDSFHADMTHTMLCLQGLHIIKKFNQQFDLDISLGIKSDKL